MLVSFLVIIYLWILYVALKLTLPTKVVVKLTVMHVVCSGHPTRMARTKTNI